MGPKSNSSNVQGTNDCSILSKHAMTQAGYSFDPFLEAFTLKKAPRRAPLINRGYWVRAKVMDSVLSAFLQTAGRKQIVSLGAGFDTTFFRLSDLSKAANCMDDVYYVEVDFPEVAERKRALIEQNTSCCSILGAGLDIGHDSVKISTGKYCLIGTDLADTNVLKTIWRDQTNIQDDIHTLLLSECVMTYMDHSLSTKVIQFAKSYFCSSLFLTYEQVEPLDAFGRFMRSHFDKLNSSLKGICKYPTKSDQAERYKACGYEKVRHKRFMFILKCLPSTLIKLAIKLDKELCHR